MKKRVHFKRRSKDAIHGRKGYYISIAVAMRFKKTVNRPEVDLTTPYIDKALNDLTKDYPDDIIVDAWYFSATRSVIYVFLWAPEKYLGRYLSRVARRIRNSDRHFEKYFKDGMFKYSYIYS